MKFCVTHWAALRSAIDAAGLSGFVSKGGEEAVKRMEEGAFDPLLNAHNALVSNALQVAGLQLMQKNADGSERCPMCFIKTLCTCGKPECGPKFEAWIQRAVDEEVAYAKEQGLLLTVPQ